MDNDEIEALLNKHKEGNCSEAETALVEAWLLSMNKKVISKLEHKDLDTSISLTKRNLDEAIAAYESKLVKKNKVKQVVSFYIKIAAVFVIVLSFCTLTYIKKDYVYNVLNPVKTKTFSTIAGKQSKIILIDGTEVWLNAASSLSLNDRYNKESREVTLIGEAFFKVTKDSKPFIVKIGNLKTKVLGTSFNIQAYPAGKNIEIALLTGKIRVSSNDKQHFILIPNQNIVFDKQSGKLGPIEVGQTSDRIAWKEGKFIFNDTPIEEVFQRLQRAYNLDFDIRDKQKKLTNLKFYGRFDMSDHPKEIIEAVCKLIDAKFIFQKDKVIITI